VSSESLDELLEDEEDLPCFESLDESDDDESDDLLSFDLLDEESDESDEDDLLSFDLLDDDDFDLLDEDDFLSASK
jgi:hypothetical protein